VKVLVTYGSWQICRRIIDLLDEMQIKQVVWQNSHLHETYEDVVDDHPDIAILDVESGSFNGMEVMRKLKKLEKPSVVIMTSDIPYRQYKEECLKHGADYFFYLPEEIDDLELTLHSLAEVHAG
jgi:DNA-binding response OmpR family regulator